MTSINSILLSLKKSLTVKGSNIDEVIEDFDRRHTGFISAIQFQRLISSCGIYLPQNEYDLILKSFSAPNNMVNLNQFSEAVKNSREEARNIGDAMRSNLVDLYKRLCQRNTSLRDVLRPYDRNNRGLINKFDFLRAVGSFPSSQAISEAFNKNGIIYLPELLQEYEKSCQDTKLLESTNQYQNASQQKPKPIALENAFNQAIQRKIDLRESFFAVDRLKTGKMSQFHFQTALSNSGLQLTPNDTTAITRYYQCDYDLIDYFHFLRDADQYRMNRISASQNLNANLAQPVNSNELIRRISSTLLSRKVHPSHLFPPNSFRLTKPQFSSVLRQSGLGLSAREIDHLCATYEDEKSYVNVQLFESTIQSAMSSLSSSTIRPSFSLTGVRQRVPNMVDCGSVLGKISASLAKKNVQLAPRFQRFDRENSGEFNVSLVNAVIKNLGIDPLTEEELDSIQSRFAGSVYPNIRWQPFASAVDPQIQNRQSNVSEGVRNEEVHSGPPLSVVPMLQYVKQTADRNRLTLLSEFRQIDRNRVGFIQPSVFSSFMMREFPRLTKQHIEQLLSIYGGAEFHYVDLCRDIGRMGQISSQKDVTSESSEKVRGLSQKDAEVYSTFLRRIKAFCTLRMLTPTEIFTQQDTSSLGFVRSSNLERCFAMIHFPATKEEVALIVRIGADPNNNEKILYRPIARDIENTQIEPGRAKWILNESQMKKDSEINATKIVSLIKDKLKMRNRRIFMFFGDARPGVLMRREEFAERLGNANIVVQGEELDDLVGKYQRGSDQNGAELVDWESFVNDVDNISFFA